MSFIYKILKHFSIIFISIIFFYGCPGSSDNSDIDTPLGNLQFTYLQHYYLLITLDSNSNMLSKIGDLYV